MNLTPPFTLTANTLNVLIDNRFRSLPSTHPGFQAATQLLRSGVKNMSDLDALRELLDIPLFIAKVTHGLLQCSDSMVLWDGQPLHTYATGKLLAMLAAGADVMPLVRFIERSMQNPLATAREELYQWMEIGGMPLMPDGRFAAFKRVNDDYSSTRTSAKGEVVMNRVGDKPQMPRHEVNPNRRETCAQGLHFCSYAYLPHFPGKRVMILAVDPADVVAIPEDYGITKGRAWTYEVVGEVPEADCAHLFKSVHVTYAYADDDEEDIPDQDAGEGICGDCGEYVDYCTCGDPAAMTDDIEARDENGEPGMVFTRDATPNERAAFANMFTDHNAILDALQYIPVDAPQPEEEGHVLVFIADNGRVLTLDELLTDVEVFGAQGAISANDLNHTSVNVRAMEKPKGTK